MGLKKEIKDKVKEHVNDKFTYRDVDYVPNIEDKSLTFGNYALKFNTTVLRIDLRGSTKILNNHTKGTVAKIHKSYYYAIVKIVKRLGGEPRSFDGDSLLVFFQGTKIDDLNKAVRAAMEINYIFSDKDGVGTLLKKYTEIDYGIGIDDGEVYCTKVGIGGAGDNKDLFWIGNSVNKSTRLSDLGKTPNNIYITKRVYDMLEDEFKFTEATTQWGTKQKVNMWVESNFNYNNQSLKCYYTRYCYTFD